MKKACPACGSDLYDSTTCLHCGREWGSPSATATAPSSMAAAVASPAPPRFTPNQQKLFDAEFDQVKKDETTGVLLALLLGGIGVHHFYLGRWFLGVAYLVLCWTYVPLVVAIIEAFFMNARVQAYNAKKARLIEARILVAADSGKGTP